MGKLTIYSAEEAEEKILDFSKTYGLNKAAEDVLRQDVLASVDNYLKEQSEHLPVHQLPMPIEEQRNLGKKGGKYASNTTLEQHLS